MAVWFVKYNSRYRLLTLLRFCSNIDIRKLRCSNFIKSFRINPINRVNLINRIENARMARKIHDERLTDEEWLAVREIKKNFSALTWNSYNKSYIMTHNNLWVIYSTVSIVHLSTYAKDIGPFSLFNCLIFIITAREKNFLTNQSAALSSLDLRKWFVWLIQTNVQTVDTISLFLIV